MAGRSEAISKRVFTYEEAAQLLPHVQHLTATAVEQIDALGEGEELADQYQAIIARWAEDLIRLGIEVKGLWLIDFDCGSGYYCWQWPEPGLQFFHGYEEGFRARVELN
jgi:hypothetical protein